MVQHNLFDDSLPEMEPGQAWRELALIAVQSLARTHLTFTTNEVWGAMPVHTPINKRRAMGPIMNAAVKSGWIENSGQFVTTGSHGRPIPVYRSRIIAQRSAVA